MSTLRKLVSDVRSTHKILSTDARITDRAIASEVKNNAITLIKRETNLRRLWASDTLFTTIPDDHKFAMAIQWWHTPHSLFEHKEQKVFSISMQSSQASS